MKGRILGKGLAVVMLVLSAGACGSDGEDTLYKWSCTCSDACATTLDALFVTASTRPRVTA
jgi:hypothetical protein